MYILSTKNTQSEIYIITTDCIDISLFLIKDYKVFKELLRNKVHLSTLVKEIFEVHSPNQNIEAVLAPFDKNLWIPCLNEGIRNRNMGDILQTFAYSLDIPIKTAQASFNIKVQASKHEKGVKVQPDVNDVVIRPPYIVGFLLTKTDETAANPFFSLLVPE